MRALHKRSSRHSTVQLVVDLGCSSYVIHDFVRNVRLRPTRVTAMIAQQMRSVCRTGLLLLLVLFVSACSGTTARPDYSSVPATVGSGQGRIAAQIALQQVGVPYRYGGQSPSGFDCSGLVHYSYSQAGKAVPRTTAQLWSGTMPVSSSDMQAGDVLFFSIAGKMSHVGLYLGDGRFVHAPSTGKTVSVESLSSAFYRDALIRAGRPR